MAGNERLSYEIAAIYSGSPEIKKAFDDFARLNAQGQRVVNQLERMGNQVKKTGEEIRNSRQGAAQLGMQFNQLGTQVASGTSVFTALAQQIGDVGYAMSFMQGTAGKVGSFLAGPWGAAIGIAAVALGPFINKLFEVRDAAQDMGDTAEQAVNKLYASLRQASLVTDALDKVAKQRIKAMGDEAAALRDLNEANAMAARLSKTPGAYAGYSQYNMSDAQNRLRDAQARIRAADAELDRIRLAGVIQDRQEANARRLGMTGGSATGGSAIGGGGSGVTASVRNIESEQNAYERLAERLRSIVTLRTADTEAIGRAKNELAEFDKLIQDITGTTVGGEKVGEKLIGDLKPQIDAVRQQLVEATLGMQEYMTAIPPMSAAAEEAFKRQKDAIDSVGMSVANAFKGMLTAGASWKDGMKGIIQTVIDELWRLFVVQQIVGMVSSAIGGMFGGGGLSKKDPLAKAFDAALPGRAIGGSVTSNTPYLVGEKGPEIFVPGGNGTIIPNKNMGGASGAPTINVTVDARGSADPAAVRAQVQQGILEAAPAIVAAAQQRTVTGLRRPKLGGVMQ